MIGHVISNRYVVEAVVGTGGMAIVYRAYDKISKNRVAIKVLRPNSSRTRNSFAGSAAKRRRRARFRTKTS